MQLQSEEQVDLHQSLNKALTNKEKKILVRRESRYKENFKLLSDSKGYVMPDLLQTIESDNF